MKDYLEQIFTSPLWFLSNVLGDGLLDGTKGLSDINCYVYVGFLYITIVHLLRSNSMEEEAQRFKLKYANEIKVEIASIEEITQMALVEQEELELLRKQARNTKTGQVASEEVTINANTEDIMCDAEDNGGQSVANKELEDINSIRRYYSELPAGNYVKFLENMGKCYDALQHYNLEKGYTDDLNKFDNNSIWYLSEWIINNCKENHLLAGKTIESLAQDITNRILAYLHHNIL